MLGKIIDRLFERRQEPNWHRNFTEGLAPADKVTLQKLQRSFEGQGPNQQWVYVGALSDFTPLLFSPNDATHHLVDPSYASNSMYSRDKSRLQQSLAEPWAACHIPINLSQPDWSQAFADGAQTLQIKDGPTVQLQGEELAFAELPAAIDVIYTNHISHDPEGAALERLKVGGFIVMAMQKTIRFEVIDRSLEDFGFESVAEVNFNNLTTKFSRQQANQSIADDTKRIRVFKKTREFSPAEAVELKFHALVRAITMRNDMIMQRIRFQELDQLPVEYQRLESLLDDYFKFHSQAHDHYLQTEIFVPNAQSLDDIPDGLWGGAVFNMHPYPEQALAAYRRCADLYYQKVSSAVTSPS